MTLALYGKSRKRRGTLLLAALLAVLAATVGGLAIVGSAFAHTSNLSGSAVCNGDGTWTVTWTADNDWSTAGTISNTTANNGTTPAFDGQVIPKKTGSTNGTLARTSVVPSSNSSVTLSIKVTWPDNATDTASATVSRPSNCAAPAKIIVRKVVAGSGASADQAFPVVIDNSNGSHTIGDASGNVSQNTPFVDTFQSDSNGEPFTVTEGTLPTGWAYDGWKFGSYNEGVSSCSDSNWKSQQSASGGALDDVENGDTVVVCFRNTYTAPPAAKINLSHSQCSGQLTGVALFHFLIPAGEGVANGAGGALSGTYKVDNGPAIAFGPVPENINSSNVPDWDVTIPFPPGSTSITFLTATSGAPGNGVWPPTGAGRDVATYSAAGCVPPPVVNPTVSKVAHSSNQDANFAYWDIVIDQPSANAAAATVVITDAHADIAISSQPGGNPCSVAAGVITCNVGTADLTITVKRPITALATGDACNGGTIENYLTSAKIGATNLTISTGNANSKVTYTVPANPSACGNPTAKKTLTNGNVEGTSVTNPADVKWTVTISNPANGSNPRAVQVRDQNTTVLSGPTSGGSGTSSCTGTLNSVAGANCNVAAGGTISWNVAPATTPVRTCADQNFNNTAQFSVTAVAPTWVDFAGPTIKLTGDASLCNGAVDVYKIVTNVASDPTSFSFTTDYTPASFNLTDDHSTGSNSASTGTHTVTEGATAGYTQKGWKVVHGLGANNPAACNDTNPIASGSGAVASFSVASNSTTVLCFFNEKDPTTVHVVASKIVCTHESSLPNTTEGNINANTATDFVANSNGDCHFESGWTFEWGFANGTGNVGGDPGAGNFTGSRGAPWTVLGTTDGTGSVAGDIPAGVGNQLNGDGTTTYWMREQLKPGYLPFSNDASPNASYSAEIGCYADHVNFDNFDRIDNTVAGQTYYCVAWNVKVRTVTILKDVDNVTNDSQTFDIKQDNLPGVIGSISETGSGLVANIDGGSHTFTEVLPDGYAYDGYSIGSCTAQVQEGVATVPSSVDNVTICLHNHKIQGRLIIEKMNLGSGADQADPFSGTYTGPENGNFSGLTPSNDFQKDVTPGTYTVHENAATGYQYIGYTIGHCVQEEANLPRLALVAFESLQSGDAEVKIGDLGSAVVCLHNQPIGTVVLIKNETVRSAGAQTWDFTSTPLGDPSLTTAANNQSSPATTSDSKTFTNVAIGSYVISETQGQRACQAGATSNDFQTNALAQFDAQPSPTDSNVVSNGTLGYQVTKGHITYIVYNNKGCGTVLATSDITVKKFSDPAGNFTGNVPLDGWQFRVTGTPNGGGSFDSGFQSTVGGMFIFLGVPDGTYTITETPQAGWTNIGSKTGGVTQAGLTRTITLGLEDHKEVDFYNQPLTKIHVTKTELNAGQGTPGAGWTVTLTGCGQNLSTATDANGNADFTNLPLCANYVVSENTASKAGFTPVTPATVNVAATTAGQTYNVSFMNGRITVCVVNCGGTPTPTPTATATPVTPTPTPNVPTATPTTVKPGSPTPTITEDTLGEKTPGPGGKATPIAPSTGNGFLGGGGSSSNVMLALLGLLALSGGLATLAFGRNKRS